MEHRCADRIDLPTPVSLYNTITNQPIGQVGNMSATGLMLVTREELGSDRIFQGYVNWPDSMPQRFDLGLMTMWSTPAPSHRMFWTGCAFLSIRQEDEMRLAELLASLV